MDAATTSRAMSVALQIAREAGLAADDAIVVHNSNKLSLRVLPCDVFERVAVDGREVAELEIGLAERLADVGSPVADRASGIASRVFRRDGFAITWWTFYDVRSVDAMRASGFAAALARLHRDMRTIDVTTPHVLDRVAEAEGVLVDPALSPALDGAGRRLLLGTLTDARVAISRAGMPEQLLHGEPHPGNVLATLTGPRFIDFETCCRGPVEFDVAHVPIDVAALYPNLDLTLLDEYRRLVLARVAAWRWDVDDDFPDGLRHGRNIIDLLEAGPPWPTIADLDRH